MGVGNHKAHLPACFLTGLIGLVVASASVNGQQQINATPSLLAMCWSKSELAGQAKEIRPRWQRRSKRIAPPNRRQVDTPSLPDGLRGVIRRVKIRDGRKLVALTFDLCEQGHEVAGYDGRVVDILRRLNVTATFFSSGKWLLSHPERAAQLVADPLFEMANHSWSHKNLKSVSGKRLQQQIYAAQTAYEMTRESLLKRACFAGKEQHLKTIPKRMGLFRYPFGTCGSASIEAVNGAGLLAIQWDISTGDPWRGQSANAIIETVLQRIKPGSIVLAHANGRGWNTWKALPKLISELKARGYEFVTVSELLAAGEPEIVDKCFDQRVGDTERWARKSQKPNRRRQR